MNNVPIVTNVAYYFVTHVFTPTEEHRIVNAFNKIVQSCFFGKVLWCVTKDVQISGHA